MRSQSPFQATADSVPTILSPSPFSTRSKYWWPEALGRKRATSPATQTDA